jgi:hypothetical protein
VILLTLEESAKLVYMAASVFPGKQDTDLKLTAKAWMMILNDIPYKIAEAALIKVLSTAKFFPVPADIREAANSFTPGLPTAEEAWLEVYHNARVNGIYRPSEWSSKVIKEAVDGIGWRNICYSENLGVERAHFMRIYGTLKKRQEDNILNEKVLKLTGGQALLETEEA